MPTIQIADKPTLDNIATNARYIKNNLPSGGGGNPKIIIINTDSKYTGVTFTVSNKDFEFSQSVTLSGTSTEIEVPYLGEYKVNATITGSVIKKHNINITTVAFYLYNPEFIEIKAFSDCTDEELEIIINAHYVNLINISDYWSVGDTRIIHLDAFEAPKPYQNQTWKAQDIAITILEFNHTDLATPINGHTKAALTLQTREVLSGTSAGTAGIIYVNGDLDNDTNFSKWSILYMRSYLNDNVYNAFPSAVKALIKPSKHYRHTYYNSTVSEQVTDNLFLPSYPEVFGTNGIYNYYVKTNPAEGTQISCYNTNSIYRIKYPNNNGVAGSSAQAWWIGSPSSQYSSSSGYFGWLSMNASGNKSYNYGITANGLAPAFAM